MVKEGKLWGTDPPKLSDRSILTHDVSCQGVLSATLWKALDPNPISTAQGENRTENQSEMDFSPEAIDRIMGALGNSMSCQMREPNDGSTTMPAPSSRLAGNVISFNRQGKKWCLLVENARLSRTESKYTCIREPEDIGHDGTLEILAFDDTE